MTGVRIVVMYDISFYNAQSTALSDLARLQYVTIIQALFSIFLPNPKNNLLLRFHKNQVLQFVSEISQIYSQNFH